MTSAYPALMQAGHIGQLQLKNRIVMAPMGSNFAEADGFCGERIQAYYETRAKGGAGEQAQTNCRHHQSQMVLLKNATQDMNHTRINALAM